jgi:murein L,D-transpeptidase YcbB/YkuD
LYWKLLNQHIHTMSKLLLFIILLISVQVKAQNPIVTGIESIRGNLYYPRSVERFYRQNDYKLAWIAPDTVKTHSWDALLLLDCVRQYGLFHDDYHPKELLYDTMHRLIEKGSTDAEKARTDIFLTDAMIRFINDLHFGKLNPAYAKTGIDKGSHFKADNVLLNALKNTDLMSAIDDVQPKLKLYVNLQRHMRRLVGLRSGDCYVIPVALVRKMAINMERLRWMSTTGKHVRLTCIVWEGSVIYYKDIYKQDIKLEKALYNEKPLPVSHLNINPAGSEKFKSLKSH